MSTSVFPTLVGLGWDVVRTASWEGGARVVTAVSGKETAIAYQANPRWLWELTFDLLRSDAAHLELQTLAGFFNARRSTFDSFLYRDADDNTVAAQALGIGDGAAAAFQLVRTFGGFTEPVLAPQTVAAVYLDGVAQPSGWTVSTWGSSAPGVITFVSPPAGGVVVTADFAFYWPCRFVDQTMEFNKFMQDLWAAKSVKFRSIK
jgi:uncharacterized protein (TIGR02217 family)